MTPASALVCFSHAYLKLLCDSSAHWCFHLVPKMFPSLFPCFHKVTLVLHPRCGHITPILGNWFHRSKTSQSFESCSKSFPTYTPPVLLTCKVLLLLPSSLCLALSYHLGLSYLVIQVLASSSLLAKPRAVWGQPCIFDSIFSPQYQKEREESL